MSYVIVALVFGIGGFGAGFLVFRNNKKKITEVEEFGKNIVK